MSNIYAYWEGENRHWFYDLCWETVKLHNPNAVLLGPSEVRDILDRPIPSCLNDAYVTHRCDWIRKAVISKVGGLWLDMDYICWSDLSVFSKMAPSFDYIGYKEWGGGWMDNFFAGRVGSPILSDAADFALEAILRKNGKIEWLEASTDAITKSIEKHKWEFYCQIPTHLICPISVNDSDAYREEISDAEFTYQSFGAMASRHSLGSFLDEISREELIKSSCVLATMIRKGLGLPEPKRPS